METAGFSGCRRLVVVDDDDIAISAFIVYSFVFDVCFRTPMCTCSCVSVCVRLLFQMPNREFFSTQRDTQRENTGTRNMRCRYGDR